MIDHIKFLRDSVAKLRELAQGVAPDVAGALRRMADELEAKAADLENSERGPSAE